MTHDIFDTQRAIDLAAAGEPSPVVIYWDTQDPDNVGPAYRYKDGSESGSIRPQYREEELERWFWFDGEYTGPNEFGHHPEFIAK